MPAEIAVSVWTAVIILGLSTFARVQGTATIAGTVRDTTTAVLLRFEVFNLLKRANFGIPSTSLAFSRRQAQPGLKLAW